MVDTCPGCGAGPVDQTQLREWAVDYWCGTARYGTFVEYSIECFTNQLAQRDARIKELEGQMARARTSIEEAKCLLAEALSGQQYNSSWMRPLTLPMAERRKIFDEILAILDREVRDDE